MTSLIATKEKTTEGRPVYLKQVGPKKHSRKVSEISQTFQYKGDWINIPSIHNGKEYKVPELIKMLDKGTIKPTSTHKSEKEAVKSAIKRSKSLLGEKK